MFSFISDVCDYAVNQVEDVLDDPLGYAVEVVTQPIVDTVDILDGLSEGELREKAALRLGVDIVSGMPLGEVVEFLSD